jgi:predicted sulfurtransferase
MAVSAFYRFVTLDDPRTLKAALLGHLQARGLKGTIMLAPEVGGAGTDPAKL